MKERRSTSTPRVLYPNFADAEDELQNFADYVYNSVNNRAYGTRNVEQAVWVLEAFANLEHRSPGQYGVIDVDTIGSVRLDYTSGNDVNATELSLAYKSVQRYITRSRLPSNQHHALFDLYLIASDDAGFDVGIISLFGTNLTVIDINPDCEYEVDPNEPLSCAFETNCNGTNTGNFSQNLMKTLNPTTCRDVCDMGNSSIAYTNVVSLPLTQNPSLIGFPSYSNDYLYPIRGCNAAVNDNIVDNYFFMMDPTEPNYVKLGDILGQTTGACYFDNAAFQCYKNGALEMMADKLPAGMQSGLFFIHHMKPFYETTISLTNPYFYNLYQHSYHTCGTVNVTY